MRGGTRSLPAEPAPDVSAGAVSLTETGNPTPPGPLELLRDWWRRGRLQLGALPVRVRAAAGALIAVFLATFVMLFALATGRELPGGHIDVPNTVSGAVEPVSLAFMAFLWVSLAVLASASLLLAGLPETRRPRLVLVVIGLITLSFMGALVAVADTLHTLERQGIATGGLAGWRLVHAAAWGGVVAAVATMVVPRVVLRSHAAVPVLLGGGPYLGGLAITFTGDGARYRMAEIVPGLGDVTAAGFVARPVIDSAFFISIALVVMLYWQAATWARAGRRDVGLTISAAVRRWLPLLWVLLLIKVIFIVVGYAGIGPCGAREQMSAWTGSACDGLASWVIAGLFAALVGAWLLSPRRQAVSDRHLLTVAAVAVIGFSLGFVVLVLVNVPIAIMAIAEVGPPVDVGPFPGCLESAAGAGLYGVLSCALNGASVISAEAQIPAFATIGAFLAGGAVLVSTVRFRMLGLTLLIFGVWGTPRAFDALLEVAGYRIDMPSFGIELATFDTALTVVLVAVALVATRARNAAMQAVVTLVLVVSTLAAHGATLLPMNVSAPLGYLLLAAPLAYLLLVDSHGLNEERPDRPARVLGALVGGTALLVVATTALSLGSVDIHLHRLFPALLFLVPYATVLVGASATALLSESEARRQPTAAAGAEVPA